MQAETLIKFFLVLIPLLLLWGFSYWFAHYRNAQWPKNNLYLEKLETLALGPGNTLQLIKLGEEKLVLLSVSAGRTDMIISLDSKDLKPLGNKKSDFQESNLKETGEKS